jgi:hypothetical protein
MNNFSIYIKTLLIRMIELLQWTKIEPKGPSLQPRSGHCAVQSGDEITIFGGTDGRTFFNDVWVLDTRNFTCICMNVTIESHLAMERA